MLKHTERRHLPYTAAQLFALVADVEKYPEFIEWFAAARIRHRHRNVLEVEQAVQFAGLSFQFTTRAVLDPPRQILIVTTDPPFKNLDQRWTFTPARDGDGTIVQFDSTLELHSGLMQHVMWALFSERQMAEATVDAFQRRALQIYGPSPPPSSRPAQA
jgi:coenzyme Q-binding protein COQ10